MQTKCKQAVHPVNSSGDLCFWSQNGQSIKLVRTDQIKCFSSYYTRIILYLDLGSFVVQLVWWLLFKNKSHKGHFWPPWI